MKTYIPFSHNGQFKEMQEDEQGQFYRKEEVDSELATLRQQLAALTAERDEAREALNKTLSGAAIIDLCNESAEAEVDELREQLRQAREAMFKAIPALDSCDCISAKSFLYEFLYPTK